MKFEQWLLETEVGRQLWDVEGQLVRNLVKNRRPGRLLQIGGLPLLSFSDHALTHYIHQHDHLGYFSPGHSVCAQASNLPIRDESLSCLVCPHTHELYDESHQYELFKEWSRVLKPDGYMLILGVNLMGYWTLQRLISHNSLKWAPRIWSLYQLEKTAKQADLQVVDIQYFVARAVYNRYGLGEIGHSLAKLKMVRRFSPCYAVMLTRRDYAPVWGDAVMFDQMG